MLFYHMAWRNIWRYRRRSLLTIGAISLGLAFFILLQGFADGFHEQMVDNSVRAHIGHIEIERKGYRDNPGLNKTLPHPEEVRSIIQRLPNLRGYSLRVQGDGLISTSENSAGVAIVGVDPQQEVTVTTIHRALIQGTYLDPSTHHPILIGARLAKTLQAGIGDKVVLLVQAADGSMGADQFRVVGIFRSGSPDLDQGMVYVLRSDAQELFALGNGVTQAVLLLQTSQQVDATQQTLAKELTGDDVEILAWSQVEPFLKQFIQLDDAFLYIMGLILFAVISIGILNTILMSVFERVHEFGVMMSLGTKPRQIVGLVMNEALLLGLVGIALGFLLGCGSTLGLATRGVDLSSWAAGTAAIGITSTIVYTKVVIGHVVWGVVAVLGVVLLVALYPAIHASRLEPVQAMRHI